MKLVRVIVNIVTTIALAVSLIGAGLVTCATPPITHALGWVFADDATSPFDRNQLVQVADATRDYSFGNHDLLALYQVIYDTDVAYRDSVGYSAASTTGAGFPRLSVVKDRTSVDQLRSAFAGASEMYCYSQETVAHLDDCHRLANVAIPLIIAVAIVALAGLIFTGVTCRRRRLGGVFVASGALVILAFVGLAAWAIVDFQGFFATLHGLFFSKGSWQFPYDSLLICALPQAFWAGMGVVCLAVSFIGSLILLLVGKRLLRRR